MADMLTMFKYVTRNHTEDVGSEDKIQHRIMVVSNRNSDFS